jgi:hypothetical protein
MPPLNFQGFLIQIEAIFNVLFMQTSSPLWEHQETSTIVEALLRRLRSGMTTDHYDITLLNPLQEAFQLDLEEHPGQGSDMDLDTRIDRLINTRPELLEAFQKFVEDAFIAGPNGDGQPQHFAIPETDTSPHK